MERPTIGVLSPLAGGFYFGGILKGIARATAAAGGRVIAIQTLDAGPEHADDAGPRPYSSRVAWDHVDGFISVLAAAEPKYLAGIQAADKPLVMVSHTAPGVDCPVVVPDNHSGIEAAVRHLVAHGHRRIGFAGFLAQSDMRERLKGYQETLRACGIEPDPALLFEAIDTVESGGASVVRKMLAAGMPATATVAATDLNAIGMLESLSHEGMSLPDDHAITGFDDTQAGAFTTPRLTSVRQDFGDVGERAANLLLASIRGDTIASGRHLVPTALVVRESCGCSAWSADEPDGAESPATPRDALIEALVAATGRSGPSDSGARTAAEHLAGLIDAAARLERPPVTVELRSAMARLCGLAPTWSAVRPVVDAVRHYSKAVAHDAPDGERRSDAAMGAVLALCDAQLHDAHRTNTQLRDALSSQYDVNMDLLHGFEHDPRELAWMRRTRARAGALGIWTSSTKSTLEIEGVFEREGDSSQSLLSSSVPLESFPPRKLLEREIADGEAVLVVPVKSGDSDWGWIASISPVELTVYSGRETLNQWAALLTVALDDVAANIGIQRLEREMRAILETSPDAIVRYDSELRYEYMNAAAAALLGKPDNQVAEQDRFERRVGSGAAAAWEAGLRQVLTSGTSAEVEFSRNEVPDKRWYQGKMVPQFDDEGKVVGVLTSTRDMTTLKRAELALAHQAVHDALTGLANRTLFVDRLTQALHRLDREPGQIAVMFIDVDRFKPINDSLGHEVGDRVLIEIARRLTKVARRTDTVARFGGDEFVLLCDRLNTDDDTAVHAIAQRVVSALDSPVLDGARRFDISGSVGVAVTSNPNIDVSTLLRDADTAMYEAKERGGNQFRIGAASADQEAS